MCLEKMKYAIQDQIGTHFLDKVIQEVKAGKTFSFVLDNIDWEEKVHDMRADYKNKSVHAVATSVVFDRIPSTNLDDEEPQQSLSDVDIVQLVELREDDLLEQRQMYKMIAAKILYEHFPAFGFLKKNFGNFGLSSKYKAEMEVKSTVVPFPVLLKDEKNMERLLMYWINSRHGSTKYMQRLASLKIVRVMMYAHLLILVLCLLPPDQINHYPMPTLHLTH